MQANLCRLFLPLRTEAHMNARSWRNAKSSAWYCTALLARGQPRDVDMALEYIRNILQQQYTQEGDVTYGT